MGLTLVLLASRLRIAIPPRALLISVSPLRKIWILYKRPIELLIPPRAQLTSVLPIPSSSLSLIPLLILIPVPVPVPVLPRSPLISVPPLTCGDVTWPL